jgi:hypothetical protein
MFPKGILNYSSNLMEEINISELELLYKDGPLNLLLPVLNIYF